MNVKIPREQTEFTLDEGLLAFLFLYPGQAQDSFTANSKAYKAEWAGNIRVNPGWEKAGISPDSSSIVKAVALVAQIHDPDNWQRHVFRTFTDPRTGALTRGLGKIGKLEETDRDISKYPYYQGKYVLSLSAVYNPATLQMKDYDATNPEHRAKFQQALDARAPLAYKFANWGDPADVARLQEVNRDRVQRGLQPYQENQPAMLPLMPHEIWAGCFGSIRGRAYWSKNSKPATVNIALEAVLMTRQGERLVASSVSPDAAFSSFAPAAELAPPAPGGFMLPGQAPPPANGGWAI